MLLHLQWRRDRGDRADGIVEALQGRRRAALLPAACRRARRHADVPSCPGLSRASACLEGGTMKLVAETAADPRHRSEDDLATMKSAVGRPAMTALSAGAGADVVGMAAGAAAAARRGPAEAQRAAAYDERGDRADPCGGGDRPSGKVEIPLAAFIEALTSGDGRGRSSPAQRGRWPEGPEGASARPPARLAGSIATPCGSSRRARRRGSCGRARPALRAS